MLYAVTLSFDVAAEGRVRQLHAALRAVGLTPAGRPHVTLGVAAQVDDAQLRPMLQQFARRSGDLTLDFHALGLFPTSEGVLYLAVTLTPHLLALHAAFDAQFDRAAYGRRAYYLPGEWVPHCTLAHGLTRDQLATAAAAVLAAPWPASATVAAIGLVAFGADERRQMAQYHWGSGEPLAWEAD